MACGSSPIIGCVARSTQQAWFAVQGAMRVLWVEEHVLLSGTCLGLRSRLPGVRLGTFVFQGPARAVCQRWYHTTIPCHRSKDARRISGVGLLAAWDCPRTKMDPFPILRHQARALLSHSGLNAFPGAVDRNQFTFGDFNRLFGHAACQHRIGVSVTHHLTPNLSNIVQIRFRIHTQ